MSVIFLLVLLGLLVWFWQDSMRAREQAREAGARACQQSDVQLLDDTVALEKLWPRRDRDGRLCLERHYVFEFTDNGATRRVGFVSMMGRRVEVLHMEGGDLIIP